MSPLLRSACLLLGTLSVGSCASVPAPATKAPDNPASATAAEGRVQKLELFVPAELSVSPAAEAGPPDRAMPAMDHSKMDHSTPMPATSPSDAKPTIDPSADTYTCLMHPQIAEPKPGKCPICGMPLVKKAREKK